MSNDPIGIFDSGIGGTSIWREIHAMLPHEHTLYLADSNHAPYGERSRDEIIALSIKNTELLLDRNCKLIVVACNTATTNAIGTLRERYDVPFVGIEPAIKPAALNTKTGTIGILATKGTLSSALFHETTNLFASGIKVIEQVGLGIVTLIESGKLHSPEMNELLREYLIPMIDANIDHLVLGCTHYPYLIPQMLDILPDHVKIIDSGEAVARQTKALLQKHDLLNTSRLTPKVEFYSNAGLGPISSLLGEPYKVDHLDF